MFCESQVLQGDVFLRLRLRNWFKPQLADSPIMSYIILHQNS